MGVGLRRTVVSTLFATLLRIHEPQELQGYNCAFGFIGKSVEIKYNELLSNVKWLMENCVSTSLQRQQEEQQYQYYRATM